MLTRRLPWLLLAVLAPTPCLAAQDIPTNEELARRLDLLAQELEDVRLGEALAPPVADTPQEGLGPAASKIYRTRSGVSIGGYAEAIYTHYAESRDDGSPAGKSDTFDFLRAVFYFGYKFDDDWLFNSEIEFEHATTGQAGQASVEFAYLEYQHSPELHFRVGMVLVPMGFVNELHEPTTFLSADRPRIERVIMPSTWRENGVGVTGTLGEVLEYRVYLLTSLDAAGFTAGGLRGGRQSASKAKAEDLAAVGRVDWRGLPGVLAGVSAWTGEAGQDLGIGARTTIFEGHLEWRQRGLRFRLLGVAATVDDAAALNGALGLGGNQGIGEDLRGWYAELGYDILTLLAEGGTASLTPFLRYESWDTQATVPAGFAADPASDGEILTVGLAWQPIPQVIFKLDLQNEDNGAGTAIDTIHAAAGLVF